jgi:RNA polymerase sigma-70 factor (ECF subfamily)
MWSLSDESLLAGLASGDADAATAFVRRFQGRVFGLALTILRDPVVAEEVSQEAFVRAWQHASAYDPRRGRVSTWLLAITRNLAIDSARMRRAEPVDPQTLAAVPAFQTQVTADATLADAHSIMEAIAELPDAQGRALVLAAIYGRTAAEIAELEGAPLGTVKSRIRAALSRVRSEVINEP